MLRDRNAQSIVEYIVAAALFVLLAAPVLYGIYVAISGKLSEINVQIGS